MKHIEEIEKAFDAEFPNLLISGGTFNGKERGYINKREDIKSFYRKELTALLEKVMMEMAKLKRTDDTQMKADHIYDEALDDVASLIRSYIK